METEDAVGCVYRLYPENGTAALMTVPDDVTGVLDVPAKVSDDKGREYQVTSFAADNMTSKGFSRGLTGVILPEGLTSVGSNAFEGCSRLTSVSLPSTLKKIGNSTFKGCSSLATLHVPDNVNSIGGSAFSGCSALTSIRLPSNLSRLQTDTFKNCRSLATVTVPENLGKTMPIDDTFSGCPSDLSFQVECKRTPSSTDQAAWQQRLGKFTNSAIQYVRKSALRVVEQQGEGNQGPTGTYDLQGLPAGEGHRGLVVEDGKLRIKK